MEREETKAAFAEAYRRLQSSDPQRRMTVKDVAVAAGYDRHTFYYHFKGLNDLVSWIFDQEISRIITQDKSTWGLIIPELVQYVSENRTLILSIHHSSSHDEIERLLINKIDELIISYMAGDTAFSSIPERKKDKLARFLSGGIVALIDEWLRTGLEESSDTFTEELLSVVRKSLEGFQAL